MHDFRTRPKWIHHAVNCFEDRSNLFPREEQMCSVKNHSQCHIWPILSRTLTEDLMSHISGEFDFYKIYMVVTVEPKTEGS